MPDKVVIGKIVNTRGLGGELKVINYSSFLVKRFKKNNNVIINNITYTISKVSINNNIVFLFLNGISSIDDASKLVNYDIEYYLKEKDTLKKDYYYYHDLIGVKVYQFGKYLGDITKVLELPSQHTILVKGEKEFNFPFLKHFIKSIDINKKELILNEIEGLYEN